ncbi:glycosyltransferase family 4 protein [Vibrio breoganii]|uniref:glycosyltransferase family 4 protein n=1 Tax=Vibrio breoganii TaxID=553239 RepID=UPI000C82590B|nr:glycosyltransferase family 4 protein [Vibrio breoganii]PMG94678.1 hypothetical protein BCU79_01085 [Vibrio breoganii]PMK41083.1 hypothetical protein BCU00_01820 [Vibrio breoganii]
MSKVKKIIHVQVLPKMSGVQKVSFDILKNLPENYEKYILFGGELGRNEELEKRFNDINVEVIYLDELRRDVGLHDLAAFKQLYYHFKTNKYDIVHTNSSKPAIIARIAAKLSGVNFVVHTIHGIAFHKYEKSIKRLVYWSAEYFSSLFGDKLISVNRGYLSYFPLIKNKTVIYNAIEENVENEKSHLKDNNIFTVGFLSRLDTQKDPLTLLKAVKCIKDKGKYKNKIKFIFGGDGELKDECISYVNEFELEEYVTFIGWVSSDTKSSFYQSIDVFCLPSIYEAFGLVLLEAAQFSKTIIASNVEGIPEVVTDGETGLLFDAKNYELLASKILLLYNDPKLLTVLSNNASLELPKKFDFKSTIEAYIKVYDEYS